MGYQALGEAQSFSEALELFWPDVERGVVPLVVQSHNCRLVGQAPSFISLKNNSHYKKALFFS